MEFFSLLFRQSFQIIKSHKFSLSKIFKFFFSKILSKSYSDSTFTDFDLNSTFKDRPEKVPSSTKSSSSDAARKRILDLIALGGKELNSATIGRQKSMKSKSKSLQFGKIYD